MLHTTPDSRRSAYDRGVGTRKVPWPRPEKAPARISSIRAGGDLLFNGAVVVSGDQEDAGNGQACDDKGDHV